MSNGTITMTGAEYDALAGKIAALEAENARLRAGQEPVAYITGYHGGRCIIEPVNRAAVLPSGMALYTAPQPSAGVVMPDVSAMAKVLSDRSADACNIDRGDNWAMYGQEYIDDVEAMLSAARLNGKEVGRG